MRIILDTDKKQIIVPWNYQQKLDEYNKMVMEISNDAKKKKTFTGSETILTLVTCTNYVTDADGRVIVHGVMDGYESFFVD